MASPRAAGALAILIACVTSSFAVAQTASITPIAFGHSQAISDDGLVVVGQGEDDEQWPYYEAFRWDTTYGQRNLGSLSDSGVTGSYAYGTSADGKVVAGWTNIHIFAGGWPERAFRWTKTGDTTGAMVTLGHLADNSSVSHAYDVSDDGNVIVGFADTLVSGQNVRRAFMWTFSSGRNIGPTNDPFSESAAWGVSGDGKVVVGQCRAESTTPHAFRWTTLTGMADIGALGPLETSVAKAISRNGEVIVGNSNNKAFIKHSDNPMTELPKFSVSQTAEANDVSFDGRVVVGELNNRAVLWIDGQPQYLSDLLASYGIVTSTDWSSLDVITGCSADGRFVTGDGRHRTLSGSIVFRVYLPLPNRAPEVTSTDIFPGETITLKLGQTFETDITGTDPDLENLTLTRSGLPSAATLDPPAGTTQASPFSTTLTFTPGVSHVGTHNAIVRFTDSPAGDSAELPFTIVVPPNSVPVVTPPAPLTAECDGRNRIVLNANVADADNHRLTVEWFVDGASKQTTNNVQAGSNVSFQYDYPDGVSEVQVRAKDAYSNWIVAETLITIQDTTEPSIIFTPTLTIPTDPGIDFATKPNLPKPRVEDLCDGDPTLTSDAPPTLPLGETMVNWTATDDDGNVSTAQQRVIVEDQEAPEIVTGSDVKKFVDRGETYATIRLPRATVTDNVDQTLTIKDNSRPRYPIGVTKVTYTCVDDDGNVGKATLDVEVVNRKPKANAGANIVVNTKSERGATVKLDGSRSSDPDGHTLKYRWTAKGVRIGNPTVAAPQATFPVGKTTVTLTVTDEGNAKHTDTVLVTVRLTGAGARRSLGAEANVEFGSAASAATKSLRSGALGDAAVAGFENVLAAEAYGDAAGEFVRWNEGQSEAEGAASYAGLRYIQALYGSEAATQLLEAYLETGDENALDAALAAARGVEAAAADLTVE